MCLQCASCVCLLLGVLLALCIPCALFPRILWAPSAACTPACAQTVGGLPLERWSSGARQQRHVRGASRPARLQRVWSAGRVGRYVGHAVPGLLVAACVRRWASLPCECLAGACAAMVVGRVQTPNARCCCSGCGRTTCQSSAVSHWHAPLITAVRTHCLSMAHSRVACTLCLWTDSVPVRWWVSVLCLSARVAFR